MPKAVPEVSVCEELSLCPFVSHLPIAALPACSGVVQSDWWGASIKAKPWNGWNEAAASLLSPGGSCASALSGSMGKAQ